jgi:hypothetical protein
LAKPDNEVAFLIEKQRMSSAEGTLAKPDNEIYKKRLFLQMLLITQNQLPMPGNQTQPCTNSGSNACSAATVVD